LCQNYADFGPTLAMEKLEELHGLKRDKNTIRSILISEKLWQPKQKKKRTTQTVAPKKNKKLPDIIL